MIRSLIAAGALALAALAPGGRLPDPGLTPGAVAPVTTAQVCQRGYARHARHPYDRAWRRLAAAVRREYGVRGPGYRIDHLVPIEDGGAPFDIRNLWPQPTAESHVKDDVENAMHARICAGTISLAAAQREFMRDWRTAR
ncbi:MAG: hypothetical protein NVSMB21_25650 [Vulcanimicrobiaceae bacterium]